MATFIELRTDSFANNVTNLKRSKLSFDGVRRPLRGIEIKEDTYSVIKVIKANGDEIPLVDAGGTNPANSGRDTMAGAGVVPSTASTIGGARTYNYSNYIIQSVTDSRQEKQQIIETFGESYIFFFGERPRVLNVSGVLFNTLDFNWRTEFWWNYEHILRGTKLVELNARVYLHWDDIVVEGYILSAQAQDDANSPYHVPFSFTMFVTNHTYLNQVGDDAYPIRHAVDVEPLQKATSVQDLLKDGDSPIAKSLGVLNTIKLEAQGAVQPTTDAQATFTALKNAGDPTPASKFNLAKNVVTNAIALGVNAQNLTFLSLVNRFFNQRKMKLPRGLAGSESNTGPVQVSGLRTENMQVKRTKPLRSKISDNKDEYIGSSGSIPLEYVDYVKESQGRVEKLPDKNALEKYCQGVLGEMGIDPIQHGKPEHTNIFDRGHNMVATSGESLTSGKVELATSLGFHL